MNLGGISLTRRLELLGVGLVLAGATWVLLAPAEPGGLFERYDRRAYDLAVEALPDAQPSDRVTVVLVDDESLARLGERWPLSRDRWGDFVQRVGGFGPSVVALDAWFESPAPREDVDLALDVADVLRDSPLGTTPDGAALADKLDRMAARRDGDRHLSENAARFGPLILGFACVPSAKDTRQRAGLIGSVPLDIPPPGRALRCNRVAGNIPRLAQAARRQASVNLLTDSDGVTRRYPYFITADDKTHPSLALAAVIEAEPDRAQALIEAAAEADRGAPVLHHALSKSFRQVRFSDVLEAAPDSGPLAEAFADRIVLVGVSALGTEDASDAPREREIPGVMVHAQAISNLLDGGFLRTEGDAADRARYIGLAVVILSAVIAWPVQSAVGLLLIGLGLMGGWSTVWRWWLADGTIGPLVPVLAPILAWITVRLGFGYARAQEARRRENEIRRAFQHYLAPAVVETLVEDPAKLRLGGERRELTAFFSDIRGFTTISEELDPNELVVLLNECLGTMTEIILDEGGTIDKYIGDAIVAMFGAPMDDRDHALAACRAALRCQTAMGELRTRWLEQGLPPMSVRIGINTGIALVGNMGSEQRFDYTMIGDAVNLAARLEKANRTYGTAILCGERTMALAGEHVVFREVDRVRPKGKMRSVRVGELVAIEASSEHRDRVEAYQTALRAYRTRRWQDALDALAPLVEAGDGPAKHLADRAQAFSENPPPEDWDGVFTMTG